MLTADQIQYLGKTITLYKPLGPTCKAFHTSSAYIRWLFGGNRSAKTHTNMMDLAMLLMDCHPIHYRPNGVHWACIEHWDLVRDILWEEKLKTFLPGNIIQDIEYGMHKTPRRVFFKNGHRLEFKSFNQGRGSFQGRGLDSIHCDEQCEHDLEGIFTEMQARLLDKNGFLSWSMTPILPQELLEERIEKMPNTDETFRINLNDNRISRGGYIPDDRIDDAIADWPEETQATRIAGEFASYYGAVYRGFSRKAHVIEPFKIPADWERYRGIDFGFTNPFVCLWVAKDKDENWYVYREYYRAKTGIIEHIANIKARSANEFYQGTFADPENAEDRAELRRTGISTKTARKDVARGIELVQSKLKVKENKKPSLYFFKTCKNTCREMAMYQYPKGSASNNPKDIPLSKNDHTCDALRYILYTVLRPGKKGSAEAA